MVSRFSIIFAVILAEVLLSAIPAQAQSHRLFLYLRDGSILSVEVDTPGFEWRDVSGSLKVETIPWQEFTQLTLVQNSVGAQVEKIKKQLANLTSDSYQLREEAEETLANGKLTGPFQSVIREHMKSCRDPETLYRLRRVMGVLDLYVNDSSNTNSEFDKLELKQTTGQTKPEVRTGDAFKFSIKGTANDQPVKFTREQLAYITTYRDFKPVEAKTGAARAAFAPVKTFNKIDRNVFDLDSNLISFETDRSGNEFPNGKNLDNYYADVGLLMRTDFAGYMMSIKYPFKHCPIESGARCVCPFDATSNNRLKGVSVLTFCTPGQPGTVAGVNKIGLFLERVEHSRDFVIEAYNRHDQMVGMVEASDQICVFAGFQSESLITKIRVSQNDALPKLEREIDSTYALDCVVFDSPQPLPELSTVLTTSAGVSKFLARVNLDSGDQLILKQLDLGDQQVAFMNPHSGKREVYPWDKINSIAYTRLSNSKRRGSSPTMIQLTDGSIVRAEHEKLLSAYDFIGHKFLQDQVVAAWSGTCRFPHDVDFKDGKPIVVFPGCQIVTEGFKLLENGFRWDAKTSFKQIQTVQLSDAMDPFDQLEPSDPDLTPKVGDFRFPKPETLNRTSPTVWLSSTKQPDPNLGYIQLSDGQYFVLNGELGFTLKAIDQQKRRIEVEIGGVTKTYPLSRVIGISLR